MIDKVACNRELGRRINQDIWNDRKLDLVETYFTEDFTHEGFSGRHEGRAAVSAGVEKAHATFENFREVLKSVTADEERVVLHFTITGRHVGQWGPVPATGKDVAYDEIVIMTVRDGKVCHQVVVADNITGLRQIGVWPSPKAAG
jgi:predicted ester cyclase